MTTAAIAVCLLGLLTGQQQQPQAMQPEVGTLIVDAELPVGTRRGDYFEAGWLFIDGRLIGRLPVKRSVPGVEAAALDPASVRPADLAGIDEVRKHLQQTPPDRPVAFIPVSAALGGPREFDAGQLRFLARVLRTHLGSPHAAQVDAVVRDLIAILETRR